ncbi:unnamed protein product [Camellia sinensis]
MIHFIWLALQQRLHAKDLLHIKNIISDNSYQLCGSSPETNLHALRDCTSAKRFWDSILIPLNLSSSFNLSSMEWLKINCLSTELHSSSIPWAIVFSLTCWTIWKNRNSVCFEPTPPNPLKPTWTIAMATKWYHLSNTSKPRATKTIACSWNSPPIHCFKLNTDGATNENHAAAGDIIRDNHGNWVSGFCRFLDKTNSLTTELWTLRDGLKLALDMGLTPIEVESDALTLVHMVLNNCNDQHHLSNIVHDCKFLLDSLRLPTVKHIFREANQSVDALAN